MQGLAYGYQMWGCLFWICAIGYLAVVSEISYPLTSFLKPSPIICLLFFTMCSNSNRQIKALLSAALLLSSIGDVVLTLPIKQQLTLGLAVFFVAHLVYIRLFTINIRLTRTRQYLCLALMGCSTVYLWLIFPYLGILKAAVMLYLTAITVMGMSTIVSEESEYLSILGALLFMGSDALIALNHFVYPAMNFTLPIMMAYYLAQFLMVTGVLLGRSKDSTSNVGAHVSRTFQACSRAR